MTAGEKRKFYRNMQYNRTTRQVAVLGLQFLPFLGPLALVLLAVGVALVVAHGGSPLAALKLHNHGLHGHGSLAPFLMLGSLSKVRELREKRGKAAADAQALIPQEGKAWTPENRQKFDALMKEADDLKTQIDDVEREMRAQAAVDENGRSVPPPNAKPGAQVEQRSEAEIQGAVREFRSSLRRNGAKALTLIKPESRSIIEDLHSRYFAAMKDYLLNGSEMSPESRAILRGSDPAFKAMGTEFRDMGTGGGNALQGSGGGYFVPVGFVYDVEEALKYYGDMLNVSTIMDTATGQPLPYPTDNDTTVSGEIVGEGVQVTTADVTLGSITFNAYKFSTKMVKVSIELLQDSAFDLETFLKNKFAIRLGRILNTKFTVGTGTNEPKGIIVAATASTQTVIGDDNAGTPDPTTQIGYTDLVNLEHQVDPLYRRGAKFMMHDQTLRYLKTLKDKYGRPLWVPGVAVNAPDEILGYGYSINNDMAQLGTGHKVVAFGQLQKYMIRRVKELAVMRLSERFADYGQVAFLGFARYDGNLLDAGTHPVVYVANS